MESPTNQWLKELENEELEMVDHLSMEQLAESLANELWSNQLPPTQEQEQDHRHQVRQQVAPISPTADYSSSAAGDALDAFPAAVGSSMISFAAGDGGGGEYLMLPSEKRSGHGARGSSSGAVQEHVVAERKRREKMQQQFAALAAIIPDTTKTDKVSLLGSTIRYVHDLEERMKALRDTAESPPAMMFDGAGSVEARVRGTTVLLRIACPEKKGLLVMVLTEVERRGLTVVNTSAVPFGDGSSLTSITITAQIEDGSSITVELVKDLDLALRKF